MNQRFQKVEGHTNLVRNTRTGAIINTNKAEIQQAKAIKKAKLKEQDRIQKLEQEMSEIKSLLAQIVEKL